MKKESDVDRCEGLGPGITRSSKPYEKTFLVEVVLLHIFKSR